MCKIFMNEIEILEYINNNKIKIERKESEALIKKYIIILKNT